MDGWSCYGYCLWFGISGFCPCNLHRFVFMSLVTKLSHDDGLRPSSNIRMKQAVSIVGGQDVAEVSAELVARKFDGLVLPIVFRLQAASLASSLSAQGELAADDAQVLRFDSGKRFSRQFKRCSWRVCFFMLTSL